MTAAVFSPRAKADLEDIWDYTAKRWGIAQAEAYLRQLATAIEAVAAAPRIARSIASVRPGYWKFPAGSHVVFFRLTAEGIDVVRVLHGRMDVERHL